MRLTLVILIAFGLAACGVAGDPSHPAQKNSYEHSLKIGVGTGL